MDETSAALHRLLIAPLALDKDERNVRRMNSTSAGLVDHQRVDGRNLTAVEVLVGEQPFDRFGLYGGPGNGL